MKFFVSLVWLFSIYVSSSLAAIQDALSVPSSSKPIKSLVTLSSETILQPFMKPLKTALGKAISLDEKEKHAWSERNTSLFRGWFGPVDHAIFGTEEGKSVKFEINKSLDAFSFILEEEDFYCVAISSYGLPYDPESYGFFKYYLATTLSGLLTEKEKDFLPADHPISIKIHWEIKHPYSFLRILPLKINLPERTDYSALLKLLVPDPQPLVFNLNFHLPNPEVLYLKN